MAGPLSSEEIEDVVSSVRRLVSNELSPRRLSRDLGADRLLLTPSLRVVSETSPLSLLVLEDTIDDKPIPKARPAPSEALEVPVVDAVELIEAEWEDEIWVAAEAAPLGEVALGADEAEVLVQADEVDELMLTHDEDLPERRTETEPDHAEPIALAPLPRSAKSLADSPSAEDVAEQRPGETGSAVPDGAAAGSLDPRFAAQSLSTDDIHIEPAAGHALPVDEWPETSEPEAVVQVDAATDAPLFVHHAAPDTASTQDSAPPRMPAEIIDADGTPLAVLDEAALQEIVRQMIREEFQGDLGERITRNVRKLVRAEINRALIARDLD